MKASKLSSTISAFGITYLGIWTLMMCVLCPYYNFHNIEFDLFDIIEVITYPALIVNILIWGSSFIKSLLKLKS